MSQKQVNIDVNAKAKANPEKPTYLVKESSRTTCESCKKKFSPGALHSYQKKETINSFPVPAAIGQPVHLCSHCIDDIQSEIVLSFF